MTHTRPTSHPCTHQASKPDVAENLCREHLNPHPESVEHLHQLQLEPDFTFDPVAEVTRELKRWRGK